MEDRLLRYPDNSKWGIIDGYGAYRYSKRKNFLLAQYLRVLQLGGRAFIGRGEDRFVTLAENIDFVKYICALFPNVFHETELGFYIEKQNIEEATMAMEWLNSLEPLSVREDRHSNGVSAPVVTFHEPLVLSRGIN